MEEYKNKNPLVVAESIFKIPQGIKAFIINDKCFIWLWCGSKIQIFETSIEGNVRRFNENKSEVTLKACVIEIFEKNDCIYVVDENGVIYSVHIIESNPDSKMEVDDLFSSPSTSENLSEWKETVVTKVNECNRVKACFPLSCSLAVLGTKGENLTILIYSLQEFKFKFMVDATKYLSQNATLSGCAFSLLSHRLKRSFEEKVEGFEEDVVIIGLESGLMVWFSSNNPYKGPFVLFHSHQEIQSITWVKDSKSGLCTCLLALTIPGQIVAFDGANFSTLYLPDSVRTSYRLKNYILTSNFVDCYANEIKSDDNISLNCVSLPLKGVCAMTSVPGSEEVLIAATTHGSVYCFNTTLGLTEISSPFVLPDQSLLDNMLIQSQNLDRLCKQLKHEEDILKAASATVAANSSINLFQTSVKVDSDGVFSLRAKMVNSKIIFLSALWSACVEVINEIGQKEVSFHGLEHDFTCEKDLLVRVNYLLSVDDVVSVELVYFIESKEPLLIVPIGKVKIDACYLMCPQTVSGGSMKTEETLENILEDMENEKQKLALRECKLAAKLPEDYPVNSLFKTILANSQHRFTTDEWDKLTSGRKYYVSVSISSTLVLMKLEVEMNELTITCNSTKLCHQVKEAIISRLKCTVEKSIPESLVLDLQAIHQMFEVESLKEKPSGETLDLLRDKLRTSVSAHLTM